MKKVNKYLFLLTIQIMVMFILAILGTFLTDYLISINFFKDTSEISSDYRNHYHYENEWSARHIWYAWMMAILFLLSIARIIIWSIFYFETKK